MIKISEALEMQNVNFSVDSFSTLQNKQIHNSLNSTNLGIKESGVEKSNFTKGPSFMELVKSDSRAQKIEKTNYNDASVKEKASNFEEKPKSVELEKRNSKQMESEKTKVADSDKKAFQVNEKLTKADKIS